MRFDESDDVYAYLYVIDIDERKRRELRLADQAQRDSLTGLLNRQTASARIPDAFAATINDGKTGAFVIVDLDDFKNVNDGYGHLMGDRVLSGIGQHLKAAFRKQDLICRWGGDEFIVYCNDIGYDDIERRARALHGNLGDRGGSRRNRRADRIGRRRNGTRARHAVYHGLRAGRCGSLSGKIGG